MSDVLIGYTFGASVACLVWGVGMVIWSVIAERRDDRRFKAMIKGMDAGRDKALRELGVSEETIALYYYKREELLNEHTDR